MAKATSTVAIQPISTRVEEPLNEQIYQRLKWSLTVGDFKPGDALSIRGIAARLGTSTMPVREALKQLVSERALTSSTKRSFRVATLAPKQISDLFFVRSNLEAIATELATPQLTTAQIDRLDDLAGLMDKDIVEGDVRDYLSRNYSFHFTIYTAAGNAELVSIVESLWAQTGPFLADAARHQGMTLDWRLLHGKVAAAIRARDSAGARALIEQDISWGTETFRHVKGADSAKS